MDETIFRLDEILAKLGEADALLSQGRTFRETLKSIGVGAVTYRKWRIEYGGLMRMLGACPDATRQPKSEA